MEADISSLAALISDPARGRILIALLDGRSLPATELAQRAGITCQTASSHLAKLTEGRFVAKIRPGFCPCQCLDWSERRNHLAGALGSALADQLFERGWIEHLEGTRAVQITELGLWELERRVGLPLG